MLRCVAGVGLHGKSARQANLFGWQLPEMWAAVMGSDESSDIECSDDETDEEEAPQRRWTARSTMMRRARTR